MVLYDYNSNVPGDLSAKAGDKIGVISEPNSEWLDAVHLGTWKRGLIPANFIEHKFQYAPPPVEPVIQRPTMPQVKKTYQSLDDSATRSSINQKPPPPGPLQPLGIGSSGNRSSSENRDRFSSFDSETNSSIFLTPDR